MSITTLKLSSTSGESEAVIAMYGINRLASLSLQVASIIILA